jgi:hypothetical protein
MSQQDVDNAQAGYALINEAYRAHDVEVMRAHLERLCHPDVVFEPAGVLPESVGTRHGVDGMLDFMAEQMKAFAEFVHVYTMRDGLTTRLDVLPDRAAAFAKFGYPASDSAARSASPGSM